MKAVQNVLIVDDSPTEVESMSGILRKHGYKVMVAPNGEDGVVKAQRHAPDLVLMDVVMPGLNGFHATRQLSRDPLTKDIPVVLVSTKDQETDRVWGMRQGATDYLIKPVQEKALLNAIARIVDPRAAL